MKKILLIAALLVSTLTFSQSNTKGKIHLGLGWGAQLGGAKFKISGPNSITLKGLGARSNYGLRVGYGIADAFSLGVFVRGESAGYAVTDAIYTGTLVTKGLGVGLEPKVYAVNKDKFNLYFALPIGFSTGNSYDRDLDTEKDKYSGLNYGLNLGFNWYWAEFIGMSLDFGFAGVSLTAKDEDVKTKVSSNSVYFGLGLVSKFGGN